jgi:hypothetical protein
MNKPRDPASRWHVKLGWLLLIWSCSVGALSLLAFGMKVLMRAGGLGT